MAIHAEQNLRRNPRGVLGLAEDLLNQRELTVANGHACILQRWHSPSASQVLDG